jgi:hypothetical protein
VVREGFGPVRVSLVVDLPTERRMNLVLGATEPGAVEGGHLQAALEWIEYFGVDYSVPVTPGMAETEAARELLVLAGYEPDGGSVRFLRDASPPQAPEPAGVEVVELEEFQHETFAAMVAEGLGLRPWTMTFFFDLPLRYDWRCYMALIDDAPAAVAAMLVRGGVAGLCLAATVPLAESLGCQEALLRRRILDAGAAGCEILFLEIGDSLLAHPASLRPEILAAGFGEACERPNWHRARR